MCKNCKTSEIGIKRQADLDAALKQCQQLNINPVIGGFITRHAYQGRTPQFDTEQREALDRYNKAAQAMKELHNDYVFGLGRTTGYTFYGQV